MNRMTWDRWLRLFTKANAEGLKVTPHPVRKDAALCRSKNNPGIIYEVDADGCSCPAAGQCKHRALFAFHVPGMFALIVDQTTLPGATRECVTHG